MPKDDKTWLMISYILFGLLLGAVLWQCCTIVGTHFSWEERYSSWFGILKSLLAIIFGLASILWLRSSSERHQYFLDSIGELRRVKWPSLEDVKRMTIVVCIVVAIFAAVLAVFDIFWIQFLNLEG